MPVNNTILIRKGSDSAWSGINPVLSSGEPGYDLTNKILKIGDGTTPWNSLDNHKHSVLDIANFNSSVSGLLPTINNSGDNRVLTSTGSSVGISAESNLTFDSNTSTLTIGATGVPHSTLNIYIPNVWGASTESAIDFKDQFNGTQFSFRSEYEEGGSNQILSPEHSLSISGPQSSIEFYENGNILLYMSAEDRFTIPYGNLSLGSQIADTIAAFSGINKDIVSLPTGTYPSLTELSYVKGATSNIQTQLNNKASEVSNPGTNRLVTNNGTTTGLSAQSSLTFDGSLLNINGSGYFSSGITTSGISKIGGLTTYLYSDGDFITIRNSNGNDIYSTEEGMFRDSTNQSSINYINRELIDISGYTILSWGENRNIGIKTNIPNYTLDVNGSGNFGSGLYVNNIPVSLSGHTHTSSDISDFNIAVSGLIPVKHIVSGTDISVTSVSGIYTINSTVNTVAESASLITTVFNKTGSPIPKMSAVYINGGQGDQATVALAIATGDATSASTYGVTFESIPNMSTGKVVVFGALTGLNTDQFNPTAPTGDINGQVLYLSPSVSGALTLTKPSAPNHIVAIGTVVRTHQNEGVIEVRVQNGFELEELHNVAISGVTNGQFLQYNGSGLWVPSSSGNFTSLSVNGTNVSLVGHSHLSSDITDFNSVVSGLIPVTEILAGSGISITPSGSIFTINSTGGGGSVNDIIAGSGITVSSSGGDFTISAIQHIINSSNLYLWANFR